MPKRTPRRRRASVSGASPERAPEPEAEPESEFGTPTAAADVGAELAEVRARGAIKSGFVRKAKRNYVMRNYGVIYA